MISLTMSREDWRTGSIPELPLLRKQKFKAKKGASMAEKTPVTYTLLQLRTGKRWTQKEAAKKLGVSESTLSKWENAIRFPTMDQVWVIEDTYEVPLSGINFLPENTVKPYKNKQAS